MGGEREGNEWVGLDEFHLTLTINIFYFSSFRIQKNHEDLKKETEMIFATTTTTTTTTNSIKRLTFS